MAAISHDSLLGIGGDFNMVFLMFTLKVGKQYLWLICLMFNTFDYDVWFFFEGHQQLIKKNTFSYRKKPETTLESATSGVCLGKTSMNVVVLTCFQKGAVWQAFGGPTVEHPKKTGWFLCFPFRNTIAVAKLFYFSDKLQPRSLTARPWKMVVGRRSFPTGKITFQVLRWFQGGYFSEVFFGCVQGFFSQFSRKSTGNFRGTWSISLDTSYHPYVP